MGIPGDSRRDSGTIYKLFVVQNEAYIYNIAVKYKNARRASLGDLVIGI
jgi:hypothetical protein